MSLTGTVRAAQPPHLPCALGWIKPSQTLPCDQRQLWQLRTVSACRALFAPLRVASNQRAVAAFPEWPGLMSMCMYRVSAMANCSDGRITCRGHQRGARCDGMLLLALVTLFAKVCLLRSGSFDRFRGRSSCQVGSLSLVMARWVTTVMIQNTPYSQYCS